MSNDSKDKGKGPWGGSGQSAPPDLLNLIKQFFNQKSTSTNGGGNSSISFHNPFLFAGLALLAVLFIWVLAGIFVVSPAEQAVILRFGKYIGTDGAGPHWIPPFIDSKYKINVQQVRNFSYESEMLTKDENIVSVALAVQFRISDPKNYLFNVVDPTKTMQQATSSALRQVVGTMGLDSVLTTGRQELRDQVAKQLQNILNIYQTGLAIVDVNLQPAKPPEAVTAAFDDAIKAREDEQRYINKSKAYSRRVTSIAAGHVARLQQSADAYEKEVVLLAKGQVARYQALLKPYQQAPRITQDRLYLDTVADVLKKTTNILVDTGGNNVIYLPIDQMIRKQIKLMPKHAASNANATDLKTNQELSTAETNYKDNSSYAYEGGRNS